MKTTMRHVRTLVLSSCLFCGAGAQASLITFSFNGATGDEASLEPDSQPASLTVSAMTRGAGLLPSSSAGTCSAKGWTTGGTVDLEDYFTFSVTPASACTLTLTQLVLDERRSGSGITHWSVRSSLDGFNSDLATFTVPDDSNTRADQTIALPAADFSGLGASIEFRIYGYGAESALGTWRIDNVRLDGAVGGASAVPSSLPSGFAALSIVGIIGLSRCRFVRKGIAGKSR